MTFHDLTRCGSRQRLGVRRKRLSSYLMHSAYTVIEPVEDGLAVMKTCHTSAGEPSGAGVTLPIES
jgi:hypothetical protein